MGTTAYGGKGSKGRAVSGDWPIGAARCRQKHTQGVMLNPLSTTTTQGYVQSVVVGQRAPHSQQSPPPPPPPQRLGDQPAYPQVEGSLLNRRTPTDTRKHPPADSFSLHGAPLARPTDLSNKQVSKSRGTGHQ